jgi:hypothetical protein
MRKYAEDVDIAPIELMIVVRSTLIYRFYGQLMVCPGPPVSCRRMPWSSRSPYYYRTRATSQGSPLVQTSAAYLTFITLGGSPCVDDPP